MDNDIFKKIEIAKKSKSLNLQNLSFTKEIWNEITQLINLETLYIYKSQIGEVPENISNLINLYDLSLIGCGLHIFPMPLSSLIHVKEIDLNDNPISNLPEEFSKFQKLEGLVISDTLLSEFPEILCSLPKLTYLDLSKTNIVDLKGIENLQLLKQLKLRYYKSKILPVEISKLLNLEYLDLSDSKIIDYTGLDKLSNLEGLDLSKNNLNNIPEQVFSLTNLKKLNLSHNKIIEISEAAKQLINLIDIDFSLSELDKIPKGISNFTNVEKLDFDDNNITGSLPIELFQLKKLKWLRLFNNKIESIPPEISTFESLEDLNLEKNNLKTIPYEISKLKKLRRFEFGENPLDSLQFGYLISDKKTDIRHSFHKHRYEKQDPSFLNLNKLNFESSYNEGCIFLNNGKAHAIIELIEDLHRLEMNRSFKRSSFFERFRHGSGFLIHALGEIEQQKDILTKIRVCVDSWVEAQNIEFKTRDKIKNSEKSESYFFINEKFEDNYTFRFLFYPTTESSKDELIIDYNKLLKYKAANVNMYFDDDSGRKVPINDILKYIGAENIELLLPWNGTNHCTSVRIKNFKIFNDIEIKLSENINIIIGNNGLGKSSILQAITLGLLPIENNDYPIDFKDYISFKQEKSEITANWGDEVSRKRYIFAQGKPEDDNTITPPKQLLLSYGVNFNTTREQDHTKIVSEIIVGKSDLYFTKSIFDDNYRNLYDPLIILKYLDDKIWLNNTSKTEFKKLVLEGVEKTNAQTSDTVLINYLLFNYINDYLGLLDKTEQIQIVYNENEQRYYFSDINQNNLDTLHLSEGYKDYVLLLTDIFVRILASRDVVFDKTKDGQIQKDFLTKAKAVILIDEFDRHLHPIWQRKLLSKFKSGFPNIQFILTTHNPFSVQSGVGANAIQLKVEEGKIVAENSIIESKNILSIIREYFTKDFFDFETQALLKQFSEYLDKIDEGDIELVYSESFKTIVKMIYDRGEELQSIIASQLLQLNATLAKLNQKGFEL